MDFLLTTPTRQDNHVFVVTCFAGILLLCQHHYCDELSTSTPSLAPSLSALETKDVTTLTTIQPKQNSSVDVQHTKTSIISTTTTHTTRLHRITATSNDESLIDATTSIDGLCLTKSADNDENDNYAIKSISGDIIVTIILHQSDNATEIIKFIVHHINEINLLVHNVTVGKFSFFIFIRFYLPAIKISYFFIFQGVRIVQIAKPQNLLDILDAEIDYLENCVENPFGEFTFNVSDLSARNQHLASFY